MLVPELADVARSFISRQISARLWGDLGGSIGLGRMTAKARALFLSGGGRVASVWLRGHRRIRTCPQRLVCALGRRLGLAPAASAPFEVGRGWAKLAASV